jgi:subtilisin-like proprotein convertase family protein
MKRIFAAWMAAVSSCAVAIANPTTFYNTNSITITGSSPASPYPSPITVSNLTGVVSKITVEIDNLTDTTPVGVNLLLVGPSPSTRAVIMSHCGVSGSASNITLTLDDAAPAPLSPTDPLASGAYQPAKYPPSVAYPAPAPSAGSSNLLATFNGINPNGTWNLYVVDDQTGDTGSIGGWSVTITTATVFTNSPLTVLINDSASPPTLAAPYPSPITVSNLTGVVNKVTVRLLGFAHEFPDNVDMLLVGPQGQNVVLWGEVGGFNPVTNVNVTFDDNAIQSILDNVPVTSGTYLPSTASTSLNWPQLPTNVVVTQTFTPQLAAFNGSDPNGPWSLYVLSDTSGGSGLIKNGWVLSVASVTPARLGIQTDGINAILTWPATPANLTLQSNPDLSTTNWTVVTPPPTYSAGQNVVTNLLGASNMFYRLTP